MGGCDAMKSAPGFTLAELLIARESGADIDRAAFDRDVAQYLESVLGPALIVCSGINLEYLFCAVDPSGYGCGTKLPHNITSLLGVMDGHASDLRTGLPWQMVEIHEPVRQLWQLRRALLTTPAEPALPAVSRRLPVMRWPRRSMRPSFLVSMCTKSPGFSCS